MPVNDYDPNDEESGGLEDGFTPAQSTSVGSASEGPKSAPQQSAQPQGYVPWSSFASANEDVSKREAGKLEGQVKGDVAKAQGELSGAQDAFNAGIDANYGQPKKAKKASTENTATGSAAAPAGMSATEGTSNPWESFLSPTTAEAPAPPTQELRSDGARGTGLQNEQRMQNVNATGLSGAPSGAKDLEAATGATAWSQLLGDTAKASDEAHALGSEEGVQASLQHGQTSPVGNSAFDAALINGAGQKDFRALDQAYGGDQLMKGVAGAEQASQDRWSQLQGDIAGREGRDASEAALKAGDIADRAALRGPRDVPLPPKWVPVAGAGGASPSTELGGTEWNADDQGQWAENLQWGQETADKVKGTTPTQWTFPGADDHYNVQISFGNGGDANSQNGFGSDGGINVAMIPGVKPPQPDYEGWWGGATSLHVGDASLTPAQWYALARMTPEQRAKWWKNEHPGG